MIGAALQGIYGTSRRPLYMVTGDQSGGKTNVSFDAINWTQYSTSTITPVTRIQYGNRRFVRMSSDNTPTGSVISQVTAGGDPWYNGTLLSIVNQQASELVYGSGKFVISFATTPPHFVHNIARSTNGINWTSARIVNTAVESLGRSISFDNGYFISGQGGSYSPPGINTVEISTDAVNWTGSTLPSYSSSGYDAWNGNNKMFVLKSGQTTGYISSNNGSSWSSTITFTGLSRLPEVYGNGYYTVFQGPTLYRSTTGYNWATTTNTYSVTNIIFSNGLFVGVSNNGTSVATSPDANTWTLLTSSAPSVIAGARIAYG